MAEETLWEYRVESFGKTFLRIKDDDLSAELNDWGEEGWEVVSATPIDNSKSILVIAKRPLTQAVRRERSWG